MLRVIGLMSGTSLDGIDAALIETDGERALKLGPGTMRAYTPAERKVLRAAVEAALAWKFDGKEPDFSEAEAVLTESHAKLVENLLTQCDFKPGEIDLIGFHGQTVLHRAPKDGAKGRTRQIGDGAALAQATGIDVVHDFRTADMEAGGQGAPLAPLYHQALVDGMDLPRPLAVLNLGGVANVTWLGDGDPVAFDTGPANGLIDAWCEEMADRDFDEDGTLAAAGAVDEAALGVLMGHPYFADAPPKSLDRWDFSLDPVRGLSVEDGAATLTAFTARTVGEAITSLGAPARVLATGGGRRNPMLMKAISDAVGAPVDPVEAVGWRGDLIEAEAFAWLAARSVKGLATSLPSTTGCGEAVVGGRLAKA